MVKKKVMVIDDSTTNLSIAKSILENEYDVLLVRDGEKALSTIEKKIPDLILLDILMPNMDGYEVIKNISNLGFPYSSIPIIFLTSKSDDESEILGLDLGAVDYIRKPFSAPILLKRVQLHLKFQNQNKQLLEQKEQLTEYSSLLEENVIELQSQNFLNDTMIKCIATLVQGDNIDVSMNKLLEIITNYYGAVATKILYKSNNTDMIKSCFSYSKVQYNPSFSSSEKTQEFPMIDAINFFRKFEQDGIAYISSIDYVVDIPIFYKMFVENDINSLLFVPLMQLNEIVGFLGVQNNTQNRQDNIMVRNISAFIVNHIIKYNLLNKLEELSFSDTLTGLYNRNYYNNYIDEYVIQPNNKMGIIFGDINGLKVLNDNFGHEKGDKLIKDTALFLRDNIDGLIFRIGGDEFVCFLENIEKDEFDRLVDNLKYKIEVTDGISISVGATWNENFDSLPSIISLADKIMYDNKNDFYK